MTTNIPAPWCQSIADELHRIAYDLGTVGYAQGDLPEPGYVQLHIQPSGTEDERIAAIDDLGLAAGKSAGEPQKMHDGTYHYAAEVDRGSVLFKVYTSIDAAHAERIIAEREQADKDAEIYRLRARVAELEAHDPRGLNYTRADSAEADDPTPVSPARVPMHTGGMTAEGLVDETPAEPVTVYFSFGHGQTDPGTGKDLLNHYVTVIGPSYEACREAMFASRFGQAWAFDYPAGTPQADEWIPQWTEHERFEVS